MTTSPHRLTQLPTQLPTRDTTLLPHLARVRLLTGAHLDRLLARPETTPETTARHRRRTMTRLQQLGLVTTLDRRIGGTRAGSTGHIYTLTPTGHRYLATLTGQPPPPHAKKSSTPSALFLAHTLAISDIYVHLIEASHHHTLTMPRFVTEPACWQPTGHGDYLKPDAYLILATSPHQDCWWLEIDQNTESLPRIRTKCRTYLDYLTHGGLGPDDVPPRILFTAPDTDRSDAIHRVIIKLSIAAETDQLICVTTHAEAAPLLVTELHTP
jgi:hypothetical protein